MASESGVAQTRETCFSGVVGPRYGTAKVSVMIWKVQPETVTVGCAKLEWP